MNATPIPPMQLDPNPRDVLFPTAHLGDVLQNAWRVLLRRWFTIFLFTVCAGLFAIAYVVTATPVYRATGAILIDPRVGGPDDSAELAPGLLLTDGLTVDSELRVLSSRELTGRVVETLGITGGQSSEQQSWTQRVSGILGLESNQAAQGVFDDSLPETFYEERRTEATRRGFANGLDVQRAGNSFVIDIAYTSPDIELAPRAVNAVIQEYLTLTGEQQRERVERNQQWLVDRVNALEKDVEAAENAVTAYQQENALLTPSGALLPVEIALNSATQDLISLRSQLMAANLRSDQLAEQIAEGDIAAIRVSATERTPALTDFQSSLARLKEDKEEKLPTWDPESALFLAILRKQDQLEGLIMDEFRLIHDRLQSQTVSLSRQVAATEGVIAELRLEYAQDAQKTVELRNLEREASVKRDLYERMLADYNTSTQMLTFDSHSARVIAWAVPPDRKAAPRSKQLVVLAIVAGLVLAVGYIFAVEALDNSFRTAKDVSNELGLQVLGVFPTLATERTHAKEQGISAWANMSRMRWRKLSKQARRLDFAAMFPRSVSAETMRSVQVQLDFMKKRVGVKNGGVVVGFTSTVRDEGKTTTAGNFATYLASQGEKTVLLDLDLVSRSLSQMIGPILPQENRLLDVLEAPKTSVTSLALIPELPGLVVIGDSRQNTLPASMLNEALKELLDALRAEYTYVVVDLPPVQGASDTLMLAAQCDAVAFALHWGRTTRAHVRAAVQRHGVLRDRVLGVVFTRAAYSAFRKHNEQATYAY